MPPNAYILAFPQTSVPQPWKCARSLKLTQMAMNQLIEQLAYSSEKKSTMLFSAIRFSRVHLNYVLRDKAGTIWVDSVEHPEVALLVATKMNYVAGNQNSEAVSELLERISTNSAIIYPDKEWKEVLIRRFHPKLCFMTRTNLSSKSLDIEYIRSLKRVSEGFVLQEIGKDPRNVIQTVLRHSFLWETAQRYIEHGVGFCVMHEGRVVSAAFSAFPYEKELEIDVWTEASSKYRRKGLATAACAALIEYCLENGVTPHWDAQDERSVRFALKLGYTKPERYEIGVRLSFLSRMLNIIEPTVDKFRRLLNI